MKIWLFSNLLSVLALCLILITWHQDSVLTQQKIDTTAQLTKDAQDRIDKVSESLAQVSINPNQESQFLPEWKDVRAVPEYTNQTIEKRNFILISWLDQTCVTLLKDKRDLLKDLDSEDKTLSKLISDTDALRAGIKQRDIANSILAKEATQDEINLKAQILTDQQLASYQQNMPVIKSSPASSPTVIQMPPIQTYIPAPSSGPDYSSQILQDYLKDPYHHVTVITPNGITHATVIDNH